VTTVDILRDREWVDVTRFEDSREIHFAEVSPTGRWLAVWHRARGEARTISIYDLAGLRLQARFIPGCGGSLEWTPYDTLLHRWGAGTSCRAIALYDTSGRTLDRWIASVFETTPDRRALVIYPSMSVEEPRIRAYELRSGRPLLDEPVPDTWQTLDLDASGADFRFSGATESGGTFAVTIAFGTR
jgi:hypothetical protein